MWGGLLKTFSFPRVFPNTLVYVQRQFIVTITTVNSASATIVITNIELGQAVIQAFAQARRKTKCWHADEGKHNEDGKYGSLHLTKGKNRIRLYSKKEALVKALCTKIALARPNESVHVRNESNRPFPSSLVPLLQSESKCETILMKMTLIYMKMKLHAELIFIWKVSHLDSFWNRGWSELGNGLLIRRTYYFKVTIKV